MLVSSTATGHGPLPGSVAANTKPLAVQVTGVFGGASGVLEVLFGLARRAGGGLRFVLRRVGAAQRHDLPVSSCSWSLCLILNVH